MKKLILILGMAISFGCYAQNFVGHSPQYIADALAKDGQTFKTNTQDGMTFISVKMDGFLKIYYFDNDFKVCNAYYIYTYSYDIIKSMIRTLNSNYLKVDDNVWQTSTCYAYVSQEESNNGNILYTIKYLPR